MAQVSTNATGKPSHHISGEEGVSTGTSFAPLGAVRARTGFAASAVVRAEPAAAPPPGSSTFVTEDDLAGLFGRPEPSGWLPS